MKTYSDTSEIIHSFIHWLKREEIKKENEWENKRNWRSKMCKEGNNQRERGWGKKEEDGTWERKKTCIILSPIQVIPFIESWWDRHFFPSQFLASLNLSPRFLKYSKKRIEWKRELLEWINERTKVTFERGKFLWSHLWTSSFPLPQSSLSLSLWVFLSQKNFFVAH